MTYYQLIQLYFEIYDLNNPYYFNVKFNKNNVFDRLYRTNRKIDYSCCPVHLNNMNLKIRMRKKLTKTNYEKYLFKKACNFFYHVNELVIIYNSYYYNKKNKDKINNWDFIEKNFKINRNGRSFRI